MDAEGNYVREGNEQDGVREKEFQECWVRAWKGRTQREKTSSKFVDEEFFCRVELVYI